MTEPEDLKNQIKEEVRPWGKFRSYPYHQARGIKIITVNPGESLSLQYHNNRSEFWVALDEGLEITVGEKIWILKIHEEVTIPKKTPHRLHCFGKKPARVMEIWIGDSDESDIIRIEDKYGRKE
jgi:mannose-6-phosphate isomerase-like protein (cupin superfamily)